MYSVEDLLISHGYKLPQNTATAPTAVSPTPPSSYDNKRYGDPSSCRQQILESRSVGGHRTVNGYEIDSAPGVYVYGNSNSSQPQPPAPTKGYSSSHTDNAWRDRNSQPQRREADSGNQGDTHSSGNSLTTDSGFYEGPRGVYSQPRGHRDVSYWRRRGQDFSVLLDYADFREPRGGGYRRTGGGQPLQRQEVPPEDQQQRWAVQSQAQSRSKQREAALKQWTMAAVERKCQSLGTDEWRPAVVSFARQLSESEGDSWAQAQEKQQLQQRHLRTPDGAVVVMGPRNKGKSQSLPRMLPPDSLQYVAMSGSVGSGQDVYRKVNGHPGSHHDPYSRYNHNQAGTGDRDRWSENDSRPSSQASMASQLSQVSQVSQASLVPKARFSRPLRPPSYEVHQQTRGSSETLSGDPAVASTPQPQARDRTPLPHPRMGDPRLDYYIQDGGSGTDPPGYIPPPSYPPKRAPLMRGGHGGHRGYGEVPVNYRYHQVYQQQQMRGTPDPWFGSRHTGGGGSWPEPQREPLRERSVPHRKQLYPGYSEQQQQPGLGPGIQYIPFNDPRVRQISGGRSSSLGGGNSKTDTDKIRHISNSTSSELPSVTVSDHSSDDSAFLSPASTGVPPPLANTSDLASPTTQRSSSGYDNKNNWLKQQHSDLHKETDSLDDFPAATDQNCNRYNPKNNQGGLSAFQPPASTSSVRHSSSSDQGFSETTITQVKKIVPGDSGLDNNNKNSKRKSHSETIFCLVSVPIHMQQTNKDSVSTADQNNNEKMPASLPSSLPIVSVFATEDNQNTVVQSDNSQSLRSKSLSDMGLKPPSHTSSFSSMRSTRKGPLRKEIANAWSLQASADKELCYAGSWPGDQYRNQETQTSSPVTVKGPEDTGGTGQPQIPPGEQGGQEPGHPASDTTTDSSVGTDCSSGAASYGVGYPMKGQKNLHPSSNSAFSRLSISPAQPLSLPSLPPQPTPSGSGEERDQQTSTSRKTGATTTTSNTTTKPPEDVNANSQGQVAFGQFLLKPVSRRPWDAIEELECFNKAAGVELDQVQKKQKVQPRRTSVDQCIDDLDEVYRNIMELSGEDPQHQQQHQHISPPPLDSERETVSLPDQRLNNKPNNNIPSIRPRLDSWGPGSSIDPEYREVRSAFSRPQPQNRTSIPRPLREDLVPTATLTEPTGFRDYKPQNEQGDPRETYDPRLTYRQEQDVAKESLLRDVGLTVYTEAPGGHGEQDQHCGPPFIPLTSLDPEELCQNIQLSWESREKPSLAKNSQVEVEHISEGSNMDELGPTKVVEEERKVKMDNMPVVPPRFGVHEPILNIRRAWSENSRSPRGEGSLGAPRPGRLTREVTPKDGDCRSSVSADHLSWRNEATLADRHLETLLIKEKANTLPTEDLSNLYEVKCAKGIPENETMEQRAARILGIDVAPDSLQGHVQEREEEREEESLQGVVEEREEEEDRQEHREEERETVIGERQVHSLYREQQNKHNTKTGGETPELCSEGALAVGSLGLVEHKEEEQEHRDNAENPRQHKEETQEHSPDRDRETQHVRRQYEQVMEVEVSVATLGEQTGGGTSKDDSLSVYEGRRAGGGGESQSQPSMVLELPEFPPSSLPLSLPVTPDEELALSVLSAGGGGERKGHSSGGASPRLSSSPSSVSPGCTESMAHMDKLFSVSCIRGRRLVEAEPEQEAEVVVEAERENDVIPEEGMRQAEQKRERGEMEELRMESEPEGGETEDERNEPEVVQEEEEEVTIQGKKDEEKEQEEETREEETREEETREETKEGQELETISVEEVIEPDVQQEVRPEPVSRPMKPPLLPKPIPKPRSGKVAKREITLPLSFSVSSCGSSTTIEDDELLSDPYDPSRVERV